MSDSLRSDGGVFEGSELNDVVPRLVTSVFVEDWPGGFAVGDARDAGQ